MYAKTSGWKFDEKQFDNILKSLRTSINYKGKNSNITVKKPGRHHLYQ